MPPVSRERPRVLFVGAFPPPQRVVFGGMVTSCRALLDSSLPQRAELDLLDSTQISNPPPALWVRLGLAAVRCLRFVVRFERRRPDVVLLFVAVGASILEKGAMAWYARRRGVPALMFPRGGAILAATEHAPVPRWMRLAFRGARKLLCQSETWQRFAVEKLGFAPEHAPVIRNWTATAALLAIGSQRSPARHGPVRLLFAGWLERDKGVFELVAACRTLAGTRQFELHMAGDGRAARELATIIEREQLTAVIQLRGWLSAEQLEAELRLADVFVLPSWVEGLPNAMIEAMAARLAIVVSNVGAVPDVIQDGRDGLLVPPGDVAALSAALARVIDDTDARAALAERAFAIARDDFCVERAVDRLMSEIEDARRRYGRAARVGSPARTEGQQESNDAR
jgi:glycosyltransferase involved in cell wall biosynthesis